MKRQQNTYTVDGDVAQLLCIDSKGVCYAALFPSEYYSDVRKSQWCYKGKNGIVDSLGTSFAAWFAEIYKYKHNAWVRLEPNEDYFPRNYTVKNAPTTSGLISTGFKKPTLTVTYLARVKWRSKYTCEKVVVPVAKYGWLTDQKVVLQINTYLRHHIPSYVTLVTNDTTAQVDVRTPDGKSLRSVIMRDVLDSDVIPNRDVILNDPFDLRIDPNDNIFVSTTATTIRKHRVEEGVILEIRDGHDRYNKEGWDIDDTIAYPYRVPSVRTKYNQRVSFLLVDTKVADQINDIWYTDNTHEFLVDDLVAPKPRSLKYLVCDVFGVEYHNVYFSPKMSARYAKAVENSSDPKWRKRMARYENAMDNKQKMFGKPKYIANIRMYFQTTGFNTEIYGGVGVHYLDCRLDALYRRVPDQNPADRKAIYGASRMHHETLPDFKRGDETS